MKGFNANFTDSVYHDTIVLLRCGHSKELLSDDKIWNNMEKEVLDFGFHDRGYLMNAVEERNGVSRNITKEIGFFMDNEILQEYRKKVAIFVIAIV